MAGKAAARGAGDPICAVQGWWVGWLEVQEVQEEGKARVGLQNYGRQGGSVAGWHPHAVRKAGERVRLEAGEMEELKGKTGSMGQAAGTRAGVSLCQQYYHLPAPLAPPFLPS